MAPRYLLDLDLVSPDGLQSTSPHWVVAFVRYANPITYSPRNRASITDDISFAYAERPPLVVDDQGDCIAVTVSAAKNSHVSSMQVVLNDTGTKYLNEVLPGDWVVAHMVYNLDDARKLASDLRAKNKVNGWESGMKFVGRVKTIQKRIVVDDGGKPNSVYQAECAAFSEFDSTLMYYPQLVYTDSIPASMDKFGSEVSAMIRSHESNEFGSIDINRIIPRLMQVIFGRGAWADQKFRDEPLTANLSYIVPATVLSWLGIDNSRGTFADMMRVLVGVQKYNDAAATSNTTTKQVGKLFWPDSADLRESAYRCPFTLMGSFPAEMVPQTTTTPWAFITNYVNQPVNEPLVTLRPDVDGDIFPFFTIRQTPYTSEVGADFDLATFQADIAEQVQQNTLIKSKGNSPARSKKVAVKVLNPRAPTFTRTPTTRFLELPRWVVPTSLIKEATIGRTDMMRQNLVFVFGTGPGVGPNEYDQFVNAGPVKDNLDIYRNGIRPYMPSVNCFLRDLVLLPSDWRDLMADVVMGQHLTLNGSITLSGVRAPVAPGDNIEFEGVVYHIESLTHACSIDSEGKRQFMTRFAISRGVASQATTREEQFPNMLATDPEGPPVAVTKE